MSRREGPEGFPEAFGASRGGSRRVLVMSWGVVRRLGGGTSYLKANPTSCEKRFPNRSEIINFETLERFPEESRMSPGKGPEGDPEASGVCRAVKLIRG